jgi:cytosine/adenosine deaminase-related metal-dependent hydrolase
VKIISAKYIYIDAKYQEGRAIAFNDKVIKVAPLQELQNKYPEASVYSYDGNSVIYPGFVNLHTHLEFSANRARLKYGSFIEWLYSVFENREDLIESVDSSLINKALLDMSRSGVTTVGTISSFGIDMQECADAKQRVIYFNEAIGSSPAAVDALFGDFKQRLNETLKLASESFYPAVAIHSPYSVHPVLIQAVLALAKEKDLPTTAHFLESPAEREWLVSNSGVFKPLFEKFFNTSQAVNTIEGFLRLFNHTPTLFTHCTQAKSDEFEYIKSHNHRVIHCPRSNRLLDCGKLDIQSASGFTLGTDGLSSNYSLSILDELKAALMMHSNIDINTLAIQLIESVTTNAAKALNLPVGEIKEKNFADFAIFKVPDDLSHADPATLALHTIINCESAEDTIIGGEFIRD